MDAAVGPLLRARAEGRPAHLVRVADLSGFGLRDIAEGAVVADGAVSGRLLAGLADDAVVEAVAAGDRRVRTSITDGRAEAGGLVCGGVATLVLTPLEELPEELFGWLAGARPVVLVSRTDGLAGSLAVTGRDHAGSLGDAGLDDRAVEPARELLRQGRSDRQQVDVDGVTLLLTAVVPRPRLLLVGAGAMAAAIAAQASLLDWTVEATEDLEVSLRFLDEAGPADAVVVLSHDPALDTPVLGPALRSDAGYVGAMGSRATQSSRRQRLERDGFAAGEIARIHGPIGLDLGARTPAETAVAIVAEILAARDGRSPAPLAGGAGPINR